MDEPTQILSMHRTEPTRLQSLALQLAEKVASHVENNERIMEVKQGNFYFQKSSKCLSSVCCHAALVTLMSTCRLCHGADSCGTKLERFLFFVPPLVVDEHELMKKCLIILVAHGIFKEK